MEDGHDFSKDSRLELMLMKRDAELKASADKAYARKFTEMVVVGFICAAAARVIYGSFDIFIQQFFNSPGKASITTVSPVVPVPANSKEQPQ